MTMSFGAASFRHIVDVDGQLHGLEQACVDAKALLALAGVHEQRAMYRVRGDLLVELQPGSPVRLSEDEVAFFRSAPSPSARIQLPLAA